VADIDNFASLLLEQAKRFLENARATDDEARRTAYVHSSLMLGFASMEAHVNAVCQEFSTRSELSVHERALLLEEDVQLIDGAFASRGLKIYRLQDRMDFLHARFSVRRVKKKEQEWRGPLMQATRLRNKLTHPQAAQTILLKDVKSAIEAIINAIDALYKAIYKKGLPAAKRGLHSNLTF
jgi:hypothetical protein